MRQVGVLCAAALVAVQENVSKLEGDHKNAKIFAGKLKTENSLPNVLCEGGLYFDKQFNSPNIDAHTHAYMSLPMFLFHIFVNLDFQKD